MGIRTVAVIPVTACIVFIQFSQHGGQHRPLNLVGGLPFEPLQFHDVGIKAIGHDVLTELATVEQSCHLLTFLPLFVCLGGYLFHNFISRFRQILSFIFFHLFP